MRILFLTRSLELGRDGVGDYVIEMATAVEGYGHQALCLAINDPWISGKFGDQSGRDWDDCLEILSQAVRLSDGLSWEERRMRLDVALHRFKPDWISIQLVPFGFNRYGLFSGFVRAIAPALSPYRIHIMFHEIWLGEKPGLPWKHRLLGWGQRHFLCKFVHLTQPAVMTTSNRLYQAILSRAGIKSDILRLPSPIHVVSDPERHFSEFAKENLLGPVSLTSRREDWTVFLFLFSFYNQWDFRPFLSELRSWESKNGKKVAIVAAGDLGSGEATWETAREQFGGDLLFINTGKQRSTVLSALLLWVDYGVALTPYDLLAKSTAVAAMLEHGLPVICVRDEPESRMKVRDEIQEHPLIYRFRKNDSNKLATKLASFQKLKPRDSLKPIAKEFLRLLSESDDS